jgi:hypothetical protein
MRSSQHTPANPVDDMGTGERMLAGVGKGMHDLYKGAKQLTGQMTSNEVAESRKVDAPLMDTPAGMGGSVLGTAAATVPLAMMLPASATGAAVMGGTVGALQPRAPGESLPGNIATHAVAGGAGQWGLGKLAGMAQSRLANATAEGVSLASQNAPRDAALAAGREAGYAAPPSMTGGSLPGRILEGVSGKYKTNQLFGVKNENVTEALSRKALKLPEDTPLTVEATQGVRAQAFKDGYVPVTTAGVMKTDKTYKAALDDIVAQPQKASRSFPNAVEDEISPFVKSMRVKQFDAGDAIAMTRTLRGKAEKAYASGDKELGKAYRATSDALESQIERGLAKQGKDGAELLANFRENRALMAKSYDVEKALRRTGRPDAAVYAAALRKGKPLTDELRVAGEFAKHFPDVAGVPKSGHANPFTVMDFGFGAATGNPALPMARVAARYGLLSGKGQEMFATPNYGPGMLTKGAAPTLEELRKLGLGGLLGSTYAAQQ